MTDPVASASVVLRLLRNVRVSRKGRRQQFFEQIIGKEYEAAKTAHETFRTILIDINDRLINILQTSLPSDRNITQFMDLIKGADTTRNNGRTQRRELYEECKAFLELPLPFTHDILETIDKSEISIIRGFMSAIADYFEYNEDYSHTIAFIIRDLQHSIRMAKDGKYDDDFIISRQRSTIQGIAHNERHFGAISRYYANLRFRLFNDI
jgi:hypothetical protein